MDLWFPHPILILLFYDKVKELSHIFSKLILNGIQYTGQYVYTYYDIRIAEWANASKCQNPVTFHGLYFLVRTYFSEFEHVAAALDFMRHGKRTPIYVTTFYMRFIYIKLVSEWESYLANKYYTYEYFRKIVSWMKKLWALLNVLIIIFSKYNITIWNGCNSSDRETCLSIT